MTPWITVEWVAGEAKQHKTVQALLVTAHGDATGSATRWRA